jgi:hypothetical protein
MHIDTLFNQPLSSEQNHKGVESDWLDLYEISIASGKLAFGDPLYFPNYTVQIDVPAGRYMTQARVRDYGSGRRISHLRACLSENSYSLEFVKSIPVDGGIVGVCDDTAFRTAHQVSKDMEGEDFYQKFLAQFSGTYGLMMFNRPGAEMAYVRPGWGDGIYDVCACISKDGHAIGGEIGFIEDDLDLMEGVEEYQIATLQELKDKAEGRLAGDG